MSAELFFRSMGEFGLYGTRVRTGSDELEFLSARGQLSSSLSTPKVVIANFGWTKAVKALSLLLVKSKVASSGGQLIGSAGSAASCLDYALSKQPVWLLDMFGVDKNGISLLRRYLIRNNPNRKRPGPVILKFKEDFCEKIIIRLDGDIIKDDEILSEMISTLEEELEEAPCRISSNDLFTLMMSVA